MSSTTAKIAAKDAKNTGVTPTIARDFYRSLGHTRLALVDLTSVEHTVDLEDKQSVKLEIEFVEVIPEGEIEDFLRDLSRAIYRARQPQALDQLNDQEESPLDVLRRGMALLASDTQLQDA